MEKRRKLPMIMIIITIVIFILMGVSFALPENSSSGNILGTIISPVQKFFYGVGKV